MSRPGRILADTDCERCRDSRWLTQPVNTTSSLAYAAVGAALWRHLRDRSPESRRHGAVAATALAGLSLGSVAYHGPGGAAGRRLHDASIVAAGAVLALGDVRAARGGPLPGPRHLVAATLAGLVACAPRTSLAAQGLTGLAGAGADGMAWAAAPPGSRSCRLRGLAAAAWAVGAVAQASGRTGGPLCRPDSSLQVHAAWHLVSATALGLTALAQVTVVEEAAGAPAQLTVGSGT